MAIDVVDIVATELRYALLNIGLIGGQLCGECTLHEALNAATHHLAILRIGVFGQIARAHNIVYRRREVTYGV
jgi:hypothetical protein